MLFEELEEKLLFQLQHHPVSSMGKYSFFFFPITIFSSREVWNVNSIVKITNKFRSIDVLIKDAYAASSLSGDREEKACFEQFGQA